MGARNLGRAAKLGWQKERLASQATKARKSVGKARTTSSKIKPGSGVKTSIKVGKGSRKAAKAGAVVGAGAVANKAQMQQRGITPAKAKKIRARNKSLGTKADKQYQKKVR